MATIKKAFAPIIAILAANADKRVRDILAEVEAACSAKQGGGGGVRSFHKDDAGNVVAAHCGYFGKWFRTSDMEFGAKANTASGLNSMCKEGVAAWTKQNSDYKKAKDALLAKMSDPEAGMTVEMMQTELAAIEAAKDVRVEPTVAGFNSLDELLAAQ